MITCKCRSTLTSEHALLYFKISEVTILSINHITHTSTVFYYFSGDAETLEFLESRVLVLWSRFEVLLFQEFGKIGKVWVTGIAGIVWDSLGCIHSSVLQDFDWNHRRSDIARRLLECARFNHKEEITAVTCNRDWHRRCFKNDGPALVTHKLRGLGILASALAPFSPHQSNYVRLLNPADVTPLWPTWAHSHFLG